MKFVASKIVYLGGSKINKATYKASSQDDLNMLIELIDLGLEPRHGIVIDVDKKEMTIMKIVG